MSGGYFRYVQYAYQVCASGDDIGSTGFKKYRFDIKEKLFLKQTIPLLSPMHLQKKWEKRVLTHFKNSAKYFLNRKLARYF